MREQSGWVRYSNNNKVLWFSGYLKEIERSSLFAELDVLTIQKKISIIDFKEIINRTMGHFAFVFYWGENVFASVDRICSVSIFYFHNKEHKLVSNSALSIKKSINLDNDSLLENPALEIAMSGYTVGNKTLYKNIYQLTAGECLLMSNNKLKKSFYYTYSPWKINYRNKAQLTSQLTECFVKTFEDLIKSVDDRQIVVPLSAGRDSRLVVSALNFLGFKNVFCFSYGGYNNFESRASRSIAEKLGYPWEHVPLTRKSQKHFFTSKIFEEYCTETDTLASAPFVQDISAVGYLKEKNIISQDAVFVNGNTGDFISGGHIPLSLKRESFEFSNFNEVCQTSWDDFLNKHFSLWGILRSEDNDKYIKDALENLLLNREVPDIQDLDKMHGVFECLEYLGRQSKYIVNMQRSYEFHDYNWRMPLWSNQMLDFWEGVPRIYKINQNLYKNVLKENNWGGVWHNVPINSRRINSNSLRFSRLASKALLYPFGVDTWHVFEQRVFQYFLDDTSNSSITPYYKVLLDKRRQRHFVSWLVEKYLNNKGFKEISNNFPK
jgi:asparagine synthase (glutamine-hydrolysing)